MIETKMIDTILTSMTEVIVYLLYISEHEPAVRAAGAVRGGVRRQLHQHTHDEERVTDPSHPIPSHLDQHHPLYQTIRGQARLSPNVE